MADKYQILVVDDDFSIVSILETTLTQAGYCVLTARDGETACRIAQARRPPSHHHGCDDAPMQRSFGHHAHPAEQ